MNNLSSFKFDWVIKEELAVGNSPNKPEHIEFLRHKGVISILNLCRDDEAPFLNNIESSFNCFRLPLPDHTTGKILSVEQLKIAINKLKKLKEKGIVFVHCLASVERSPLICIGYLMIQKKCDLFSATDYMNRVHPCTNPLNEQLEILDQTIKLIREKN